jgi:phage shock protein E
MNDNLENVSIIDVREPHEFRSNHIDGAINIPLGQIPYIVQELKSIGNRLVLYCQSGARSGRATDYLKSIGFQNVENGGGIAEMKMKLSI